MKSLKIPNTDSDSLKKKAGLEKKQKDTPEKLDWFYQSTYQI